MTMPDLTAIARVCHEANRAYQHVTGDPAPSPAWDEAPEWQRDSATEGVEKALYGATPEELHESWVEAKNRDGWVHGEVKDGDAKTHPCMVEYHLLPEEQRRKDALFYAVVEALRFDGGKRWGDPRLVPSAADLLRAERDDLARRVARTLDYLSEVVKVTQSESVARVALVCIKSLETQIASPD